MSIAKFKFVTCCMYSIDPLTDKAMFKRYLTTNKEQSLFSNLCELVSDEQFNSLIYTSLNELNIGETNRGRLGKFLNKCIDLNLIVRINKQIYINPKIFRKTDYLEEYVLKMFDCNYKKDS